MIYAEEKINSYRELKEGWHFGEGVAFKEKTIERALQVLKLYKNYGEIFYNTNAFPGPDGSITVTAYGNATWKTYCEIQVEPDNVNFEMRHEQNDDVVYINFSMTFETLSLDLTKCLLTRR